MYFVVALLIGISSAKAATEAPYKPAYKLPICSPKCANAGNTDCAWKDNSTAKCAECFDKKKPWDCKTTEKCMFNTKGTTNCYANDVCTKCNNTSVVCIPFPTSTGGAQCGAYVAPATKAPASNGKKLATGPIECSLLLSAFMMMMSIFRVQQ